MRKTICFISLQLVYFTGFAQQEGLTHYANGERSLRSGQYEKAIYEFNKALQFEPNNYQYLFARAQSEYQTKQIEAALTSLQKVVQLKTDFAPAYALMASIYRAKNDTEKAATYYEQAASCETNPNRKVQYKIFTLQTAIKQHNWQKAYQKAMETYQIAPDNEMLVYYVACVANKIGKYDDAIQAIAAIENKIQNMKPLQKAKLYYELGFAYYHAGEFEKASETWKKIDAEPYKNRISKFSAKYLCNISYAYFKIYDYELARQYAEKASRMEPNNTTAQVLLAQIDKRDADPATTIANLKTTLQTITDPAKQLSLYIQLAELELGSKNYDVVLEILQKAFTINAAEPTCVLLKGTALYKKGAYKAAADFIQSLLKEHRFDFNTTAELNFLLGLVGKNMGNCAIARQGFSIAMRSHLKDAAESELQACNNKLEQEPIEDFKFK
ncbi:MAG: hypothetical protein RMJ87_11795 [Cytophagales bacterium]|nr:hypothetical protein [Bernardetiaceae bacterium]MDW8205703.1 hypothetical protein [Cytophagales bacterium]